MKQILFVGDDCILENHLTSSSLFFDFGNHPPSVDIQEEMCKRWNAYPTLMEALMRIAALETSDAKSKEISRAALTNATTP